MRKEFYADALSSIVLVQEKSISHFSTLTPRAGRWLHEYQTLERLSKEHS
jgi:hypothetical protein